MSEDSELLLCFAAKDAGAESAFAEFVERRIGFVHGTAMRQTSGQAWLAGEITQTVFLVASKKAAALARHEHLTGWLYATTTLIARRMLRDTRLRRAREQQAAAMNEFHNTTQFRPAAHDLMRETLDEALALLGEKDRAIVIMRFFDGRGFAEIGALMGITGDTARMRLNRTLDKMRALYARRGAASTAAALGAFMTAEAAAAAPSGLAGSVSGAILAGGGAATVTTTAAVLAFMTSTKMAVMAAAAALIMVTFATVEVWREKNATTGLAALKREHADLFKN